MTATNRVATSLLTSSETHEAAASYVCHRAAEHAWRRALSAFFHIHKLTVTQDWIMSLWLTGQREYPILSTQTAWPILVSRTPGHWWLWQLQDLNRQLWAFELISLPQNRATLLTCYSSAHLSVHFSCVFCHLSKFYYLPLPAFLSAIWIFDLG